MDMIHPFGCKHKSFVTICGALVLLSCSLLGFLPQTFSAFVLNGCVKAVGVIAVEGLGQGLAVTLSQTKEKIEKIKQLLGQNSEKVNTNSGYGYFVTLDTLVNTTLSFVFGIISDSVSLIHLYRLICIPVAILVIFALFFFKEPKVNFFFIKEWKSVDWVFESAE